MVLVIIVIDRNFAKFQITTGQMPLN